MINLEMPIDFFDTPLIGFFHNIFHLGRPKLLKFLHRISQNFQNSQFIIINIQNFKNTV